MLSAADKLALAETLLAVVAGIWVAGGLMVAQKRLPLGMKLVTLGIAAQAASWLVYSYVFTVSGSPDGSWVLTGWQATWSLLIVGAVAELKGGGARVSEERASRGLSVWVTTVGVIVLLGLIVVLSSGEAVSLVAICAALIGVLIVVTRLHVALSDRQQLAGQMQTMAETDALTGISNRRVFDARLDATADQAVRSGEPSTPTNFCASPIAPSTRPRRPAETPSTSGTRGRRNARSRSPKPAPSPGSRRSPIGSIASRRCRSIASP